MSQAQRECKFAVHLDYVFHEPSVVFIAHAPEWGGNQALSGKYLTQQETRKGVALIGRIGRTEIRRRQRAEFEGSAQSTVDRSGEIVVLKETDVSAEFELMPAFDPGQAIEKAVVPILRRVIGLLVGVPKRQTSIVVVDIESGIPWRIGRYASQLVSLISFARILLPDRIARGVTHCKMIQQCGSDHVIVAASPPDSVD